MQPLEPAEFVIEFRPAVWVAVREVERSDNGPLDDCLDVALPVRLAVPFS
ncbi:hypothetical protein FHX03_006589 [Rhizobium sp. BK456]|nr:hypothetical protein [Rhizobium sp. BK456]